MLRARLPLALVPILIVVAGCAGGGGGRGPANRTGTPSGERPRAAPGSADTRVMMYQPKNDVLVILVNESHSWRNSTDGRLALALGDQNRPYVVVPDEEMDALVESLKNRGFEQAATPFVSGDEQFISSGAQSIPRYQGIVFVERGQTKSKVLGYRPSGQADLGGQRALQQFTDLKGVVQVFAMRNQRSEYPAGGVLIPGRNQ